MTIMEILPLSLHDALPIWLVRLRYIVGAVNSVVTRSCWIVSNSSFGLGCSISTVEAPTRKGNSTSPPSPKVKRSEEHTSELQSLAYLVCRLLLEKKKKQRM